VSEIEALAGLVRAGLDKDQRDAERHACALDCLRHTSDDWHRVRNERGRGSTMNALRSVGLEMMGQDWPGMPDGVGHSIHYVGMRGTAMDPERVLAEVEAKRALLDEILAWEHERRSPRCCEKVISPRGNRCDCGRDARVLGLLRHLAQPYQASQEESR
jgi:hypothetical protein